MTLESRRPIFKQWFLAGIFILLAPQCLAEITLNQANGETIELPAPAQRIITLAPNLAELVFAAGAGEKLEAVVAYSDFPPEVKDIPLVGDAFRVDLESIIELQPDLIIAWQSGNPQAALQKLTELGLTVWQVEITQPGQIADVIDDIARAAGTEAAGHIEAESLRQRLQALELGNAGKTPLSFFYQIASEPLYTVNGDHIISAGMEICGGHNVFAELPTLAPQISRESVILADPQIMISGVAPGEPADSLNQWLQWSRLQAVNNDAMVYIPADDISRAGPRLFDAIELACQRFDKIRATLP
jgi:iron complex transport system substrate-binding protein